jgi:flagellar assembly protein FliH
MTTSSEPRVIRSSHAASTPLATPDLRGGTWTRLGGGGALGDGTTEDVLGVLAERTRAAAEAQGYAVGWARGVREADAANERARVEQDARNRQDRERREAEHAAAVAALKAAAARLDEATGAVVSRLEEQSADLAVAVTEEVLGRRASEQSPADVVRRALDVLPDSVAATLRLHPTAARVALESGLPETVGVTPDPALSPADALVELSDSVLDLRLDRVVVRVREALA